MTNGSVEGKNPTEILQRTWNLEAFFDLTVFLTEGLAQGLISDDLFEDSRSRIDVVIQWANEFNEYYAWANWEQGEYLEVVEDWFRTKLEERHEFHSTRLKPVQQLTSHQPAQGR